MKNEGWMSDLHEADAIIVSTHSQGSIVSTHLLNRLIQDNHITTSRNHETTCLKTGSETFPGMPERRKSKVQRVCCVALCGIHLGPLRYLRSNTLVQPYIQVNCPFVFDRRAKEIYFCFLVFRVDCRKGIVRISGML